jgi:hypothetical protein
MSRILVALSLAALAAACTYSTASLDYQGHPELHAVRMWNVDHESPGVTKLGLVQADRSGWTGCDAMATDATLKLLNDARAMGGAGVVETRYENPGYWAGHPRCQRNWALLGYMTVRANGYAVKDTRHNPTAGTSTKPPHRQKHAAKTAPRPAPPNN